MTAEILDSLDIVDRINRDTISKRKNQGTLLIVSVDDNKDSELYARMLRKRGKEVGINTIYVSYPSWGNASQISPLQIEKTMAILQEEVDGTIVLQPHATWVTRYIHDDIDCLREDSLKQIFTSKSLHRYQLPATAMSIAWLIDKALDYQPDYAGKKIVIINRSLTIGKPLEQYLLGKNATVTMCHSRTPEEVLKDEIQRADVVVTATGQPHMLTSDYFYSWNDQPITIIDAGISYDEKGRLCGDVKPSVIEYNSAVKYVTTPKDGVGTLTTAILLNRVAHNAI